MEREVLLTGIGGQSVQLAASVLARAAVREDRHVMLLGTYGGTMRGGPTEATVVVGDRALVSPPIVSRCWSAIAMHHQFFATSAPKLVDGGVVVLNSSLFDAEIDRERLRVFDVPATAIATDAGNPLSASMALVAAYAAITGMVGLESLVHAMCDSLPPYRRQHLDANATALRAGYESVPDVLAPAWRAEAA